MSDETWHRCALCKREFAFSTLELHVEDYGDGKITQAFCPHDETLLWAHVDYGVLDLDRIRQEQNRRHL